MIIDQPPKLWLPPKPAIIRPCDRSHASFPGTFPMAIFTANSVSVVNTDSAVDNSDLTTYTFTSRALGAVRANRRIVVGVHHANAIAVSSMTIGGISASQLVIDAGTLASLWSAFVPTGTTGNIAITFASGQNNCGIGVWAVYDSASSAFHTAADSGSADPVSVNINVPYRGAVVAYSRCTTSGTYAWTNLTKNFQVDGDTYFTSGASGEFIASQTGRTITADGGGAARLVAASFAPL
jgi:hypothetical protein